MEKIGCLRLGVAGKIQRREANAAYDKLQHEDAIVPVAFSAGACEVFAQASQIPLLNLVLQILRFDASQLLQSGKHGCVCCD